MTGPVRALPAAASGPSVNSRTQNVGDRDPSTRDATPQTTPANTSARGEKRPASGPIVMPRKPDNIEPPDRISITLLVETEKPLIHSCTSTPSPEAVRPETNVITNVQPRIGTHAFTLLVGLPGVDIFLS